MSGAVVWTDEKITDLTVEEMGCMRAVFAFQTSLIIGKPNERFRGVWEKLRANYPAWIGFDPSRCQPNEELSKLIHHHKIAFKRDIDRIP